MQRTYGWLRQQYSGNGAERQLPPDIIEQQRLGKEHHYGRQRQQVERHHAAANHIVDNKH